MSSGHDVPTGSSRDDQLNYAVRRRTLDALTTRKSLAELVDAVGATDSRLLWHLRRLRDVEFVESTDDELGWSRTEQGAQVLDAYLPSTPGRAFPPKIIDDFEDAIVESSDGIFGDEFVQASGEHRTRLSLAQAAEFRDQLMGLVGEYFAPGQGDRSGIKYGFHWILTPVDLHPLKDAEDGHE